MEIISTNTSEVEIQVFHLLSYIVWKLKKMFKTKLLNRSFTTITFNYYFNVD